MPTALVRAEEVRGPYGFRHLFVSILKASHRHNEWGALVDAEG